MIQGKTQEDTIRLTAPALGISELEAEFIVAMEQGEISGDIEIVEEEDSVPPVPPALAAGSRQRG